MKIKVVVYIVAVIGAIVVGGFLVVRNKSTNRISIETEVNIEDTIESGKVLEAYDLDKETGEYVKYITSLNNSVGQYEVYKDVELIKSVNSSNYTMTLSSDESESLLDIITKGDGSSIRLDSFEVVDTNTYKMGNTDVLNYVGRLVSEGDIVERLIYTSTFMDIYIRNADKTLTRIACDNNVAIVLNIGSVETLPDIESYLY